MMKATTMKVSRFAKPLSPANAARKAVLKRVHRQELRRLQSMLPTSARTRLGASSLSLRRNEPDPCAVISSVIQYIDDLHATILARVKNGSLPQEVLSRLQLPERSSNLPMSSSPRRRTTDQLLHNRSPLQHGPSMVHRPSSSSTTNYAPRHSQTGSNCSSASSTFSSSSSTARAAPAAATTSSSLPSKSSSFGSYR